MPSGSKTMEEHGRSVQAISAQVNQFFQRKVPFRLYHGSTNSTQSRTVDPTRMVDTSKLSHVLQVNREAKTCLVEPNVPMDQLVDATLPYGLVPQVIMEFPGITVGGGFSGTAGESSGFRYGFFEDTINWVEIVLGSGQIVKASRDELSDLFWGAAGSFGTLGVTTMFEMRLIEAKPYVELTYHPTPSTSDCLKVMSAVCQDEANDYVDGVLFAEDHGVVVTGKMVDGPTSERPLQRFSLAQNPWFYIHAERATKGKQEPVHFTTPLRDYLFRYDRGAFWTGKYAFQYFVTPFNRITRYILDYFMHTRVMYHALHASGHASKYMIQDLLLPSETALPFLDFVSKEFAFYPLWLCPFKISRPLSLRPRIPSDSKPAGESRTFINVGVWGPGSTDYARFVQQNRLLEQKVRELGGIKWLYAQAYYTDDEFTEIYDVKWYERLREKYCATYLPTVSDKVRVDITKAGKASETWAGWLGEVAWGVWPVSGLYGVWKTLYQREYLLAK